MKKIILLILIGMMTLMMVSCVKAVWSDSLTNGLTHWWEASSTHNEFVDVIGLFNGSLEMGATIKGGAPFGVEYVLLDGINDYINAGDITDFPTGTDDFTLLFGLNNSVGGAYPGIFDRGVTPGEFALIGETSGGVGDMLTFINQGVPTSGAAGTFPSHRWVDVVWVRNSTDNCIFTGGVQRVCGGGGENIDATGDVPFGRRMKKVNFTGGMYKVAVWDRALNTTDILLLNSSYYSGGITTPSINVDLIYPSNNTRTTDTSFFFSSNYTGTLMKTFANATLQVWYQNTSLYETNYSVVDTALNITNLSRSSIPINNYFWNYYICGTNSSDNEICAYDTTNRTFSILAFTENNITFNTTSFETSKEYFLLNISTNYNLNNATFTYNGTSYSTSIQEYTGASSNYTIISSLDLPLTYGVEHNNSFHWTLNFDGFSQNSESYGQNTSKIYFSICNSTYTNPYFNVTFRDETNNSKLSASIPSASFDFYLGSGTVNKTYTYSNVPENSSYGFCFYPQYRTINLASSMQYKSTNYPQRVSTESLTLTNITTNRTYYLLNSVEGLYVTFQIVNNAEQPISGVFVNASRTIGSSKVIVATGTTGNDGSTTFWLDPNFQHTICYYKEGYDLRCDSLFPTQSTYTITLGTATTTGTDYIKGVYYFIKPPLINPLYNDTLYNFNFTLTSNYWTIEEFGFTLKNSTGTIFNITSSSANGGILNVGLNVGGSKDISMDYYYIINSTNVNASVSWSVMSSGMTDFSVFHFFEDLSSYLSEGMFGIDNFGYIIIIFGIILITTGILSYQFGLTSPASIMGFIFALVFLFDVGIGLDPLSIPTPLGAINNLPTFIVGIIFFALFIKEVIK